MPDAQRNKMLRERSAKEVLTAQIERNVARETRRRGLSARLSKTSGSSVTEATRGVHLVEQSKLSCKCFSLSCALCIGLIGRLTGK